MDHRVLYPGTARLAVAAAPDLRGRSYRITAELAEPLIATDGGVADGVLIACGDGQAGFALFVHNACLVHVYRHAGSSAITTSTPLDADATLLGVSVTDLGDGGRVELLADDTVVAGGRIERLARARLSYSGIDVGQDRGVPVGDYDAPFPFTGTLRRIIIHADPPLAVDDAGALAIELATG